MGGSWGGAGLQGTLPGQWRPEVAFCRQKAYGKVEMLTLLIAMNPTAASPTEKWTQGLLSALPTEGNWDSQGWLRLCRDFEGKTLLSSRKLNTNAYVCRVGGDDFL